MPFETIVASAWTDTPPQLQSTWVLVIFGVVHGFGFFVDEIPWLWRRT